MRKAGGCNPAANAGVMMEQFAVKLKEAAGIPVAAGLENKAVRLTQPVRAR